MFSNKDSLSRIDLGSVSEIKIKKDSSVEIKFFNKLKALEMLMSLDNESGSGSLYSALEKSAEILNDD